MTLRDAVTSRAQRRRQRRLISAQWCRRAQSRALNQVRLCNAHTRAVACASWPQRPALSELRGQFPANGQLATRAAEIQFSTICRPGSRRVRAHTHSVRLKYVICCQQTDASHTRVSARARVPFRSSRVSFRSRTHTRTRCAQNLSVCLGRASWRRRCCDDGDAHHRASSIAHYARFCHLRQSSRFCNQIFCQLLRVYTQLSSPAASLATVHLVRT